jgi:PAP2 superfamily protein
MTQSQRRVRPDTVEPPGVLRRVIGITIVVAGFGTWVAFLGLPTDPVLIVLWLWPLTIAWNSTQRWTTHLKFLRDWVPVLAFIVLYTYSRGWAYGPDTVPHVYELVSIDKAIFGVEPSVWLQSHLYNPNRIYPWDIAISFVYVSHFVTVYVVAVVLWMRNRATWTAFMWRWMVLTYAGLATYILYPAAPPWWAAQHGMIGPVARLPARGWEAIGLHSAGNMLNHLQRSANPVASMPSLHFGFALFVSAFFVPRVRKRWIPLLALYPLAMGFTLSYAGEHHVIDMIMGAVYVAGSFLVVWLGEKALAKYRGHRRARAALRAGSGAELAHVPD